MVKIRDIYIEGIKILEENDIETPKTDARVILEYVLGAKRGTLPLYLEESAEEIKEKYFTLIKKRAEHMPCSYITNKREFMALDFYVEEGVLIPRPETENLCEYVIDKIKKENKKLRVADICSGSGCIGLSVAKYCKNAEVKLFDISDIAIRVSEINKRNMCTANADIIKKDILNEEIEGEFDFIISNPPYIPSSDIEGLMEEVRDYEPKIALTDGHDGMTFYKRLCEIAKKCLSKNGVMAVEIGIKMKNDVKNRLEKYGKTEIICDDFGIERIVVLKKGCC